MTLYPRQFMRLIDGRAGGVAAVAYLPSEVGVFFSAITTAVWIEKACAIKILMRHRLRYEDLEFIQRAIDGGYILRGRDRQYLEFLYIDSSGPYRHYLLVLKIARYGQEVWVQTFHRSDETALRSRLKKAIPLRVHAE